MGEDVNSQIMDHPHDCQYSTAHADGVDLSFGEKSRQWTRRLLRAAQRRITRYLSVLKRFGRIGCCYDSVRQSNQSLNTTEIDRRPFRAGEIVRVLPYEEILATLDSERKCDGLEFMEGMRKFCNRRMAVLKRVRLIFDEQTGRMLAIKRERYILKDAICDGGGTYSQEGCDRCCFYFWSRCWLQRAS
jgi:hypothetical protein